MSETYTATIGLEVHAELNTKSKMFCGCKNEPHESEANVHICPVCLAHPGTLPVPNEEAISKVLLFGQAVGAKTADFSEFDRKNYFYPDIPKAYQISQYAFPFLTGGRLKEIELTRVHLEEDTARSQHEHDGVSLVDFNRAGVPLMELVTEPVIHDAKTAVGFARELQLLLRTLKISYAQMERGEMRVEANISVSTTADLGTKVEVKNLNSFKAVEGAIAYEIDRQISSLKAGKPVVQETRGWDEVKLKTFTQRIKETAKDYRYFPDPDIPKIQVTQNPNFSKSRLNEILPELPEELRVKYNNIGLTSNQIELILNNEYIADFYLNLIKSSELKGNNKALVIAANYLTSDVLALLQQVNNSKLSIQNYAKLMKLNSEGLINSRITKDLLAEIIIHDSNPEVLAKERGLLQSSDPTALQAIVDQVILEQATVVEEYKSGKESALQYLVGQGMKLCRGTANPALLATLLQQTIEKTR